MCKNKRSIIDNNRCERCSHNEVCRFNTRKKEYVKQLEEKMNSFEEFQDFFIFSFACKKYQSM